MVSCVPSGWIVNLDDAEIFVLVEVFKVSTCSAFSSARMTMSVTALKQSICGIAIVKDYYTHQRFNVMEIANSKNAESKLEGDGRVP